jgi:hypothetical protein
VRANVAANRDIDRSPNREKTDWAPQGNAS